MSNPPVSTFFIVFNALVQNQLVENEIAKKDYSAFDAFGCGGQLHFHRDRKISNFPHHNCLLKPHTSNAARANQP